MKLYATGFTNYLNHNDAKECFNSIKTPAVLELCKDGHAFVAWLSTDGGEKGVPYIGTQPQYNEAAKKLL